VRRATGVGTTLLGLVMVALTVLLIGAFVWSIPSPSPQARGSGNNALWLDPSWIATARPEPQVDHLAARLRQGGISDVIVPVSSADARSRNTSSLVTNLHRRAPGVRVQADLGPLLTGDGGAASTGDRAVESAESFLDLGFDGVQVGIGPLAPTPGPHGSPAPAVRLGDDAVVETLRRLRSLTDERDAVLSAMTAPPRSLPIGAFAARLLPAHAGPDGDLLLAIADEVDQLAVRVDASAALTASSFAAWVAWQTERTARLVGDRTTVVMILPAGDADSWNRHPWAEAPGPALHGLRRGLGALGPALTQLRPIGAGVSERSMSEDDWRRFTDEWVRPSG
jgi:hypothetical protein